MSGMLAWLTSSDEISDVEDITEVVLFCEHKQI